MSKCQIAEAHISHTRPVCVPQFPLVILGLPSGQGPDKTSTEIDTIERALGYVRNDGLKLKGIFGES